MNSAGPVQSPSTSIFLPTGSFSRVVSSPFSSSNVQSAGIFTVMPEMESVRARTSTASTFAWIS